MRRREFITLIGGAAQRRRLWRGRSKASGCGASACSYQQQRTMWRPKPELGHFCKGCSNRAGPLVETCGLIPAGPRPTLDDIRRHASK